MTLHVANLNGTHLHFTDDGPRNAPVLVFSNSLGTDQRIWSDVVPAFTDQFRVITYDKRGHGLSGLGDQPISIDLLARDLIALLDHLAIDRAVICGLSVGGLIAQQVCVLAPERVRAMILCDTAAKIGNDQGWNERIEKIGAAGTIEVLGDAIIERWLSDDFRSTRPVETAMYRDMLVRTTVAGYCGTCAAIRDADLRAAVGAIAVPVLCLAGSVDQSTPPDLVAETAKRIPGAKFQEIEGVGHLPCLEKPDDLCRLIGAFIKENNLV
jgi:3-oxoadipate enol-lactonase